MDKESDLKFSEHHAPRRIQVATSAELENEILLNLILENASRFHFITGKFMRKSPRKAIVVLTYFVNVGHPMKSVHISGSRQGL